MRLSGDAEFDIHRQANEDLDLCFVMNSGEGEN